MKKAITFFLATAMLLMTACTSKEPSKPQGADSSATDNQEQPVVAGNEFYDMMQTDNRPIAVMIDNDVDASRPQIGLESAYMVYEIIIEGGKSRMMALFKEYDLEKVGPIRSSRHYFLDYALEHDAIYCHAGWSPKAQNDIGVLGVNNINGILGSDGTVYWRDKTYDSTWHNLYSGIDKLYDMAANTKGYRTETDVSHTAYLTEPEVPTSGEDVVNIDIPYSAYYRVSYEYDNENGVYKRYVDGKEHMSQTGDILTAENIIIYQIENFNLKDNDNVGRQDLNNLGSGKGYYITKGKKIDINWKKDSRTEKTIYTTADGEELMLNPGNTYIQIVPASSNITLS
ncbi:MAG: DUF3048 domain-containing protein [Clostridia bacterium]|nr:DUF3048 domain-containing protein [Clostridia bacterium]